MIVCSIYTHKWGETRFLVYVGNSRYAADTYTLLVINSYDLMENDKLEVCVRCSGPRLWLGALGGELAVLVVGVKQTIHCILIVAAFNHRAGEGWNLVNPSTLNATSIQTPFAILVPTAWNMHSKKLPCLPRATGYSDSILVRIWVNVVASSHTVPLSHHIRIPELTCTHRGAHNSESGPSR